MINGSILNSLIIIKLWQGSCHGMLPVRPRCTHPPWGPLRGEPLRVPPSNASLPPLLGHLKVSCDQRGIPPWNSNGF